MKKLISILLSLSIIFSPFYCFAEGDDIDDKSLSLPNQVEKSEINNNLDEDSFQNLGEEAFLKKVNRNIKEILEETLKKTKNTAKNASDKAKKISNIIIEKTKKITQKSYNTIVSNKKDSMIVVLTALTVLFTLRILSKIDFLYIINSVQESLKSLFEKVEKSHGNITDKEANFMEYNEKAAKNLEQKLWPLFVDLFKILWGKTTGLVSGASILTLTIIKSIFNFYFSVAKAGFNMLKVPTYFLWSLIKRFPFCFFDLITGYKSEKIDFLEQEINLCKGDDQCRKILEELKGKSKIQAQT